MPAAPAKVVVIGAGMGGLAAAIRLAHAGADVTVLDTAAAPGGKMRAIPSAAGPVDAGPTVLTMRDRFDDLFALAGLRMEDRLDLVREPVLARHWWPDGSCLDLHDDAATSADAIDAFAGPREADAFRRFAADSQALFEAFDAPMMAAPRPTLFAQTAAVLRRPRLLAAMAPHRRMSGALAARFRDPRLRQLFGRYATYVGGDPDRTPAILQLIWHAEASGVWRVTGGLHLLAEALADLARGFGATIRLNTGATRLERQDGRVIGVQTDAGLRLPADAVVFNGDPRALATGRLGVSVREAVPRSAIAPRSLSARVWAFAATADGPDLIHHNVFFGDDPGTEFGPIAVGAPPEDPTLYVCAQDRGTGLSPPRLERFEIIENAAPADRLATREKTTCRTRVFDRLARFGLAFTPRPDTDRLTTPSEFDALYPASLGSLYGRSPHGLMAAFRRPTARTAIPGLYLAGGGGHPGAGIAMATLSGRHAAEAIVTDLTSRSTSRKTAMRGGMSTASPIAGAMPSRSSPS